MAAVSFDLSSSRSRAAFEFLSSGPWEHIPQEGWRVEKWYEPEGFGHHGNHWTTLPAEGAALLLSESSLGKEPLFSGRHWETAWYWIFLGHICILSSFFGTYSLLNKLFCQTLQEASSWRWKKRIIQTHVSHASVVTKVIRSGWFFTVFLSEVKLISGPVAGLTQPILNWLRVETIPSP